MLKLAGRRPSGGKATDTDQQPARGDDGQRLIEERDESELGMWPFTIDRELVLKNPRSLSAQSLIAQIAVRLDRARALEVHADRLSFKAGAFHLIIGMNPLVAIGKGQIVVQTEEGLLRVRYAMSFRQLLGVCLLLSALLGAFGYAGVHLSIAKSVWLFAGAFAWLAGVNMLIGAGSLRRMIRKSWRDAAESTE